MRAITLRFANSGPCDAGHGRIRFDYKLFHHVQELGLKPGSSTVEKKMLMPAFVHEVANALVHRDASGSALAAWWSQ